MRVATEVSTLAAAVAASGLEDTTWGLPSRPLDADRWRELLVHAGAQHIVGHLVRAVSTGALPATDAQLADAIELHRGALGGCLQLEQLLIRAVDVLSGSGIDHRVLKGCAVAHTDYPDPALRSFGDVDLLVPGQRFDEAVHLLVCAGSRRVVPELRAGFDRRFAKGTELHSLDAFQLDLHRTIAQGVYGLALEPAALFARSTPYRLAGRVLHALAPEERFLHACYHIALGPARLSSYRDVAQMLLAGGLDTQRVRALASQWQGEVVLARGVRTTWETLRLTEPVALVMWATRYVPDRRERRALDGYRPGRSEAARALASLPVLPNWTARSAFLRGLLFPARAYLRWSGHDRLSWLLRVRRAFARGSTR